MAIIVCNTQMGIITDFNVFQFVFDPFGYFINKSKIKHSIKTYKRAS